jgi:hypothetical protein|tara:strand:- start:113 stop:403 length:291 start_codon:yes stop_codon:yes gene_type:complete
MALTKEIVIEKIEVVGIFKCLQVATDTIIKEDGTEISRTRDRYGLSPCTSSKDGDTWTHTDTDISAVATEVQAIANTVWTDTVKANYKTFVENQEV